MDKNFIPIITRGGHQSIEICLAGRSKYCVFLNKFLCSNQHPPPIKLLPTSQMSKQAPCWMSTPFFSHFLKWQAYTRKLVPLLPIHLKLLRSTPLIKVPPPVTHPSFQLQFQIGARGLFEKNTILKFLVVTF